MDEQSQNNSSRRGFLKKSSFSGIGLTTAFLPSCSEHQAEKEKKGLGSLSESSKSLLPHLMKSEGRIYFAGEHASAYHGWIQGAIESGKRATKEINSIE